MVRSVDEAVEISNRFAPEHLSIPDASSTSRHTHAGSIFVGPLQSGSRGRLRLAAPNHVLPPRERRASAAASPPPTTSK